MDLWTRTRSGAPWTKAVVRTMGRQRLARGRRIRHCSLSTITARNGGEKGRHDIIGGALGGDGEVAKQQCDSVEGQRWVELRVPVLRGVTHH
jgi:hypothetical protein